MQCIDESGWDTLDRSPRLKELAQEALSYFLEQGYTSTENVEKMTGQAPLKFFNPLTTFEQKQSSHLKAKSSIFWRFKWQIQ